MGVIPPFKPMHAGSSCINRQWETYAVATQNLNHANMWVWFVAPPLFEYSGSCPGMGRTSSFRHTSGWEGDFHIDNRIENSVRESISGE